MRRLVDYLYSSNGTENTASLLRHFTGFIAGYGFESFTMGEFGIVDRAASDTKFGLLINYPQEWLSRYNQNGYVNYDPVVLMCRTCESPYSWGEAIERYNSSESLRVMDEAKDFGLMDGIALSIHCGRGRKIGFGLSTSERKIDINPLDRRIIHTAAFQCYSVYSELAFSRDKAGGPPVELTQREREVLLWVASGKTKSDISKILCVSESCVKRHCESLSGKLGTNTLAFAVAKAIRLGVINPF